jgi:hypothetical protein
MPSSSDDEPFRAARASLPLRKKCRLDQTENWEQILAVPALFRDHPVPGFVSGGSRSRPCTPSSSRPAGGSLRALGSGLRRGCDRCAGFRAQRLRAALRPLFETAPDQVPSAGRASLHPWPVGPADSWRRIRSPARRFSHAGSFLMDRETRIAHREFRGREEVRHEGPLSRLTESSGPCSTTSGMTGWRNEYGSSRSASLSHA